jgi:hypothetical protein
VSKICTTVTEKSVTQRAKSVDWSVGLIVEEKMVAYTAARQKVPHGVNAALVVVGGGGGEGGEERRRRRGSLDNS